MDMLSTAMTHPHFLFDLMSRVIETQIVIFMILSVIKIYKHKKQVFEYYSETEKVKVNYVSKFIRLTLGLTFCLAFANFIFSSLTIELIILPILSNIFYFYIVYESFNNSVLFTQPEFERFQKELAIIEENPIDKKQFIEAHRSHLEDDAKKIETLLEQKQLFLDTQLTLPVLAELSGLSSHRVSEVINGYYHQNFFEFINGYRVAYARKKITDPKSQMYTLESLAEECGFGSKVTFNRAFKKITGQTPSEYKKSQQPDKLELQA